MKNLSIVLNIILIIAVAILYVLHFSNKAETVAEKEAKVVDLDDLAIAYVNTDSVLQNYDFFKELSDEFEAKQKKAETNLQNRANGLQQEFVNFQNTAGNMTRNQAMAVQEDLQKKELNLRQYEQTLRQELMQEEAKMTDQLYTKLTDYLKDYGTDNQLQLVLTYTRGSGVLFASDSLDITNEVINGLNQEHKLKITEKTDSTASK